ncbi:MAG: histidine phosphatase family protein [Myxococcota bacterium]
MSTRVYLVRHGATVLSAEDRFAGSSDVDLSEEGLAQAAALGHRLSGEPIMAFYASPLKRTVATAEAVAAPHKMAINLEKDLREIDHGHWEGLTRKDVEERFAQEYERWDEDPFTFAPEGGESGLAVTARALPVLRAIVERHPNECVVVISHKATIRLLLSSFLGIDARRYRDRLDLAPCSLNVLDFADPVRARLMLYNDTSHYQSGPRASGPVLSRWW